ncbi:MAG TPA: hypothetical protein VK666_06420 [Chryseolinea sp.]|nr:hypothetical protein [Chryseolinea sp.]
MSDEQHIPEEKSEKRNLKEHFPEDAQAPQPATDNQQPATENMEVHHHSHPDNHHNGKKNWKAYFWEFLMLFLAVFCGFLAEYQLEHVIEHQREKQYMQSFIYDLENDTTNLNYGFPRKDERLDAVDSVFRYFEMNPNVTKIPGAIYRAMQRTTWDRAYRRNSTTIDQLRNAGGMRLIRKRIVADSIAAYDLQWQRAEYWREGYVRHQETGREYLVNIIGATELLPVFRNHQLLTSLTPDETDSLTISINRTKLNDFLNFLFFQKVSTGQDKGGYQALEKSAEQLIQLIRKEYHLE